MGRKAKRQCASLEKGTPADAFTKAAQALVKLQKTGLAGFSESEIEIWNKQEADKSKQG